MTAILDAGRSAAARHAWPEAIEALGGADRDGALGPDDLELLGTASWWAGQPDESRTALERAFATYVDAGRNDDAARVALTMAYESLRGLSESVGVGWLARATRLLDALPESPYHAFLKLFHAVAAITDGRLDDAIALTDEGMAIARSRDAADPLYLLMSFKGMTMVFRGDIAEGLALVDEAAAAATSGQLGLRFASDIFCNTIAACRNIGDLERARQWADEGERFMKREGVGGYPGVCRIHRAEIKMLRGQWLEAEQEARQAGEELLRYRLVDVAGFGFYQAGAVRLRMGDLDAAEEAFDRAYEYGHDAQPGLSLLQLARGNVADARRSIDRALTRAAGRGGVANRTERARLLPAQVEIALAADDLEAARAAVEEMEGIAVDFARPLFQAGALTARGTLLMGEKNAAEASPILSESWRLWQTSDIPYESAQARLHYAEALAAEGDESMARRDLLGARSVFERLGATRDLERVNALLGEGGVAAVSAERPGDRVTRTFMFTDIVTSTDLVSLIGDEAWNELLRWHDRELRGALARHGGEEVTHTGDGFFAAFERAADGIECAVDIQRRLARHRHEHGFAPWVRIGLHVAEATRTGRNFSGRGVHVAARVGAAADREEILVTNAVLEAAGNPRFRMGAPRSLKLKGVVEPVEVVALTWR